MPSPQHPPSLDRQSVQNMSPLDGVFTPENYMYASEGCISYNVFVTGNRTCYPWQIACENWMHATKKMVPSDLVLWKLNVHKNDAKCIISQWLMECFRERCCNPVMCTVPSTVWLFMKQKFIQMKQHQYQVHHPSPPTPALKVGKVGDGGRGLSNTKSIPSHSTFL